MKNKEPSSHKYNPKEEANAQNVQGIQSKKTHLQDALISLILWMIIFWRYFGLRKVYLKAEELAATTSPYSSPSPTQRKNSNNNNHHPTQIVGDISSPGVQQQPPHLQPQPRLQPQEQSEQKAEPQEQPQPEPQQASSSPSFLVEEEEEQEKEDNNNFINIDSATIKEKSWLYDVIKEIVYEKNHHLKQQQLLYQ
jgi:type IV secretory pathway VirB10-like protein